MSKFAKIARDGLWDQNITLVQTIGLCPTMALTNTATNGLGMGLATTAVLAVTGLLISSIRHFVSNEVRIPIFIAIVASMVTLMDMAINAWFHDLYKVLGLFIALIVANCALLGRAESFSSREAPMASFLDGTFMGLGFTGALTLIGLIREIIGTGKVFQQAHLLFGQWASCLEMTLIPGYSGMLMWILPPGGFLVMGMLLAGKRALERAMAKQTAQKAIPAQAHCC